MFRLLLFENLLPRTLKEPNLVTLHMAKKPVAPLIKSKRLKELNTATELRTNSWATA